MPINKQHVRRHFNQAAERYDAMAVLQAEVASRLQQRLQYIQIQPQQVLDLGCGTGVMVQDIISRYNNVDVCGLDVAEQMLSRARGNLVQSQHTLFDKLLPRRIFSNNTPDRVSWCCADAECLPFKSDSFDLLVSNLMMQWSQDLSVLFSELYRVIKPGGLLLFTTFGPNTLQELRTSWQAVDKVAHVNEFTDMHDIGDLLLQSGFQNPVMDMEMITMTYRDVPQLLKDIKGIGASNASSERQRGLTGRKTFSQLEAAYQQFRTSDSLIPASWEIIYGHAWMGEGIKLHDSSNVIPIQSVK